jgi:membrane protein required for beta-lactamase induction
VRGPVLIPLHPVFWAIYVLLAILIYWSVEGHQPISAMAYGLIAVCTVMTHYAYLQDRKRERNHNDDDDDDDTWPCDY